MNNMTFAEYKIRVVSKIQTSYLEETAPANFVDEAILNKGGVAILENLMESGICVNGAAGFMMGLTSGAFAAMDVGMGKKSQSIEETVDDLISALQNAI